VFGGVLLFLQGFYGHGNGLLAKAAHHHHLMVHFLQLLSEFLPHYPNLPVMYSSVRLSVGVEKIFSVSPNSTSSPSRKKAVLSDTRAACCMLWVTMITVYFSLSSTARSSI